MFGGDTPGMVQWGKEIGTFLGGLLAMAIVGVLALGSVVWSGVAGWRRG